MKTLLAVVLILLSAAPALAQDKAGAEAAFREGRRLMDGGKFAEACKQFQLSNELDPAIGTLLNLADCHSKVGQTASAWAEFTEVADKAARAGQKNRADIARRRAKELEPRLVRLKLRLGAGAQSGIVVKRNGDDVSRVVGTALPVDPGSYQIEASADGFEPWTKTVEVKGEGQTIELEIPALKKAQGTTGGKTTGGTTVELGDSTKVDSSRRRNRQIIAAVTGGVGVVSLGIGVLYGDSARTKNNDSNASGLCDANNVCNDEGFALREDAQSAATKSNIFFGVGIAAVAAGTVLWLTAPDAETSQGSASVSPTVAPNQVGLSVTGRF